jgi:hypothetical protein
MTLDQHSIGWILIAAGLSIIGLGLLGLAGVSLGLGFGEAAGLGAILAGCGCTMIATGRAKPQ